MTNIIDGKAFAVKMHNKIKSATEKLKADFDITPGLAVILVGEDPASQVYVRNKGIQTKSAGMNSFEHRLDKSVTETTLLELINKLNQDKKVNGILCQLPLPSHINSDVVINAIDPCKDVDGFHISNVGLLNTGQKALVPCTPLGCLMLLRDHFGDLSGKSAVIIGRSNIVGKPMLNLLLRDSCTVTVVHSKTKNIEEICQTGDILIAAVGKPEMVKTDWIKEGAVVIDVGINRIPNRNNSEKQYMIVGDVDFDSCKGKASAITPVPGGVGPMTISCLLANTLTACCRANAIDEPNGLTL